MLRMTWRSVGLLLVADLLLVLALYTLGKPAETILTVAVGSGLIGSWLWFVWALAKGRGRLHRTNA